MYGLDFLATSTGSDPQNVGKIWFGHCNSAYAKNYQLHVLNQISGSYWSVPGVGYNTADEFLYFSGHEVDIHFSTDPQNVGQGFLHLLIYQTCMKTKFLAPTFIFQDI